MWILIGQSELDKLSNSLILKLLKPDFQHIIDENNGILYKIARSYTRQEVDFKDLYQEILVQLWQSYPRFEGKSKVSTWMYRVALNTAMTFVKKKGRNATAPLENNFQIADRPFERQEAQKEEQDQLNALYAAINQLKKDERAIILLHLEGKQYDEIAEIIGITTSNVGVKLLRTKDKLKKILSTRNDLKRNE